MAQIVRFSGLDSLDTTPINQAMNTVLRGKQLRHRRGMDYMKQGRRNNDEDLFKQGYKMVHGEDWEDSVDSDARDLSVDDIDLEAQKSALSKALGTGENRQKPTTAEEWEAQKRQWQSVLGSDALTSHKDLTDEGEEKFWSKQRSHGSSPLAGIHGKYGRDDRTSSLEKKYFEDTPDTDTPAPELSSRQKLLMEEAQKPYMRELKSDPKAFKKKLAQAAPYVEGYGKRANMKDIDAVYAMAVNGEAPAGMAPDTIFDNQDAEREKDRLTTDFADKIMKYDNRHVSPLNMERYADKLRLVQEWEQKAMSRTDPSDYGRMTMIRDKGNQLREELEQEYGHLFRTFDNRQNPYLDMYKENQKNRRSGGGSRYKPELWTFTLQDGTRVDKWISPGQDIPTQVNGQQVKSRWVSQEDYGDIGALSEKRNRLAERKESFDPNDPDELQQIKAIDRQIDILDRQIHDAGSTKDMPFFKGESRGPGINEAAGAMGATHQVGMRYTPAQSIPGKNGVKYSYAGKHKGIPVYRSPGGRNYYYVNGKLQAVK